MNIQKRSEGALSHFDIQLKFTSFFLDRYLKRTGTNYGGRPNELAAERGDR